MAECDVCGMKGLNSYTLTKHKASKHPVAEIKKEEMVVADTPKETVLRFARHVECQVSGHKFEGKEITVPYEFVSAVCQIITESYGKDVLL